MDLFMHIFYILAGTYLAFAIIVAISSKLAKLFLDTLLLLVALVSASILIMGVWALILFLSGLIM